MQGDLEAFYLRHFKAIYRVCYAFMKNAQDAEDCTEDAFVKAMTSDVTFENERHERSWLTTTAMNICKDRLKHWWRQKVTDLDEETEQTAAEPDEKRKVVDAVMALPVKYKEVVWLHYLLRGLPDRRDRGDAGPAAVDRAESTARRPRKAEADLGR